MKKLVTTIAALGLLAGGSVASACTTGAWSDNAGQLGGTEPAVGGPGNGDLARYSGICAMQSAGASQFVQDNSPAGEATLRARFYFIGSGSASSAATIYRAYSDESGNTEVFSITADGTNVSITPAGGSAASAPMSAGWNSVEINWTNAGTVELWVNSDSSGAPDATTTDNSGSSVEAVRLGAVDSLGGYDAINFDQYESRRTTAIGREVTGDANGDSNITVFDAIAIVGEVVNGTAATGQPDCNEDGSISVFDAICIVQIVVNG